MILLLHGINVNERKRVINGQRKWKLVIGVDSSSRITLTGNGLWRRWGKSLCEVAGRACVLSDASHFHLVVETPQQTSGNGSVLDIDISRRCGAVSGPWPASSEWNIPVRFTS